MKKVLMPLCILMCSLAATAQDIIVKKDGNALTCRVVVVLENEVVYKLWTELQSNRSYSMGISDIASIRYENGEIRKFDGTESTSPVATSYSSTNLDDAALLKMAEKKYSGNDLLRKSKRLKRTGWICGTTLFVAGSVCLIIGLMGDDVYRPSYNSGYYQFEKNYALIGAGAGMMGAGLGIGITCLAKSAKLKRQSAMPTVYSAPMLQNEFAFKNGTTLAPSLNTFSDNVFRTPAVGFGLSYNF